MENFEVVSLACAGGKRDRTRIRQYAGGGVRGDRRDSGTGEGSGNRREASAETGAVDIAGLPEIGAVYGAYLYGSGWTANHEDIPGARRGPAVM